MFSFASLAYRSVALSVRPHSRYNLTIQGRSVVEQKIDLTWEASREPVRAANATTHTFEPTRFYHFSSDAIEPALHINPETRSNRGR